MHWYWLKTKSIKRSARNFELEEAGKYGECGEFGGFGGESDLSEI